MALLVWSAVWCGRGRGNLPASRPRPLHVLQARREARGCDHGLRLADLGYVAAHQDGARGHHHHRRPPRHTRVRVLQSSLVATVVGGAAVRTWALASARRTTYARRTTLSPVPRRHRAHVVVGACGCGCVCACRYSSGGESFSIGDPKEAWLMEIYPKVPAPAPAPACHGTPPSAAFYPTAPIANVARLLPAPSLGAWRGSRG